ncbi:hypothetical protein JCM10212_006232 [Sporobolomyces blumeae]
MLLSTGRPTLSLCAFVLACWCIAFASNTARAQKTTTLIGEDEETSLITVSPTLFTTEGSTLTFVATTPTTPVPVILSSGSIQNIRDYIQSHNSSATTTATATGSIRQNLVNLSNSGSRASAKSGSSTTTGVLAILSTALAAYRFF